MTSKFTKKNRTVELDIEGNVFTVDFGRDCLQAIIVDLSQKAQEVEEIHKNDPNPKERVKLILEKQKVLFKTAINEILQDETASERIFKNDDTGLFHTDVYSFLTEEYTKTLAEGNQQYSPNRAERRAAK